MASASDFLTLAMEADGKFMYKWMGYNQSQTHKRIFQPSVHALLCFFFYPSNFKQYVSRELPYVQVEFRKGGGTRDQIAKFWKEENFRKTSTSASLTTLKPLTVRITTNCGKFLINGNTRPLYLPPEKSVCRSKSKLEVDMEQQTGSKLGKEYIRLCIVTLLI